MLFRENGMWAAFAVAPALALALSFLFIRYRYGAAKFPYLLEDTNTEIIVMDDRLTLDGSARLADRDSGEILDLTDPDQAVSGLSSYVLSGLMEAHKEKAYLTTTGYNRNMIRFS